MQLSIFNSLLPQVFTSQLNVLYIQAAQQEVAGGSNGLEPSTSRLSGVCSNQLSYEPVFGGDKRIRTVDPLLARQVL